MNTKPDLTTPLLQDPAQQSPGAPTAALGPIEHLVGTWTNQNLQGSGQGGPEAPYSYNVMPLPQIAKESPQGYILKNFAYYEELTFSAIHGTAPNRGGLGTQVANTLFYEQRVYFADGPNKDALVHAENGSWLYLTDQQQLLGPYGDGQGPGVGTQITPNSAPPTQKFNLVKQVSVPHGNSILAPGSFAAKEGSPVIEAVSALPNPDQVDTAPYKVQGPGNLNLANTANPNAPLVAALQVAKPSRYIQFAVDTLNGDHPVTNIGFEQQHARVTRYSATYWLEAFESSQYTQLQYSQNIVMTLPIQGKMVSFPHITANTLTKKP